MAQERVLVIDNSTETQLLLAEMVLAPNGYQPIAARDGEEGLRLALEEHPDLIVLDMQLPKMNGLDATKEIRKTENHRKDNNRHSSRIPIIAMTAQSMKGDREKCLQAGMDDYIAKPIKREVVFAMVKKWCFERDK